MPNSDDSKMTLTPWKKHSITILLIGETGVGKTSFLDLLENVCAGRVVDEFKAEHAREADSDTRDRSEKPQLHRITCANGSAINVIDTPGLSNPREFNEEHRRALAYFIEEQIDAIDCVLILANGTMERLGVSAHYALSVISTMFPRSIVDNIAFMFTMVSSPLHSNLARESLPVPVRNAKILAINNPLAGWLRFKKALNSDDPPEEEIREELREEIKSNYDKGIKTLNSFFEWVDERRVQPAKEVDELYGLSNKMEALLSDVTARLSQVETQKTELLKLQHQIDAQKQIMKIHEQYKSVIIKYFWVHEGTEVHNTLCCAPDCYRNCHEDCPLGFTLDRDNIGRNCEVFSKQLGPDGGYICNECGHSSNYHQHYRARWVQKEVQEVNEDQHAKLKYQQAQTEEERARMLEGHIGMKIKDLDATVVADMEKLGSVCEEYNKRALSGGFVGYLSFAINLLTTYGDGGSTEARERISGHIKALERKRAILEQAAKEREARGAV
ncbi:hypothetical protein CCMSSC00406_0003455 [Pleurotus cornucopiae]|uniref:Uncharacterized protein n=1 Tax=Pleurotus cornucopiae TaxID=5321 RepID=A0ACB7J8H3_PLECO|nr:hypothetical protein CCMSSC00406_0003455 [Pleurotus cornucopiae]